jgi:hypothetical protein
LREVRFGVELNARALHRRFRTMRPASAPNRDVIAEGAVVCCACLPGADD